MVLYFKSTEDYNLLVGMINLHLFSFKTPILNEKRCNRIRIYKFDYPTFEMFRAKFLKLAAIDSKPLNEEKLNKFILIIIDRKITLRPFTIYCLRYLFNQNYLDDMITNIKSLSTDIALLYI